MEQIQIEGLRIAFERSGDGPLLVLLHGGLSDSRAWRRQIDGLRDDFTVVAWDAPGCGRSSDPPKSFRMPDYAECLASFIQALDLGPPHVVGLSFGGTLALELYRRHPASSGAPPDAGARLGLRGLGGIASARGRRQATRGSSSRFRTAPGRDRAPLDPRAPHRSSTPEMIEEVLGIISDVHPAGCRTMGRAMAEADLCDVLPSIHVPTLLLDGNADRRAPVSLAEERAAQIPSSRLVVIPDAGHESNLEASDRFNAEVRELLGSQARGS